MARRARTDFHSWVAGTVVLAVVLNGVPISTAQAAADSAPLSATQVFEQRLDAALVAYDAAVSRTRAAAAHAVREALLATIENHALRSRTGAVGRPDPSSSSNPFRSPRSRTDDGVSIREAADELARAAARRIDGDLARRALRLGPGADACRRVALAFTTVRDHEVATAALGCTGRAGGVEPRVLGEATEIVLAQEGPEQALAFLAQVDVADTGSRPRLGDDARLVRLAALVAIARVARPGSESHREASETARALAAHAAPDRSVVHQVALLGAEALALRLVTRIDSDLRVSTLFAETIRTLVGAGHVEAAERFSQNRGWTKGSLRSDDLELLVRDLNRSGHRREASEILLRHRKRLIEFDRSRGDACSLESRGVAEAALLHAELEEIQEAIRLLNSVTCIGKATEYYDVQAAVVMSAARLGWGEAEKARNALRLTYGNKLSKADVLVTLVAIEPATAVDHARHLAVGELPAVARALALAGLIGEANALFQKAYADPLREDDVTKIGSALVDQLLTGGRCDDGLAIALEIPQRKRSGVLLASVANCLIKAGQFDRALLLPEDRGGSLTEEQLARILRQAIAGADLTATRHALARLHKVNPNRAATWTWSAGRLATRLEGLDSARSLLASAGVAALETDIAGWAGLLLETGQLVEAVRAIQGAKIEESTRLALMARVAGRL